MVCCIASVLENPWSSFFQEIFCLIFNLFSFLLKVYLWWLIWYYSTDFVYFTFFPTLFCSLYFALDNFYWPKCTLTDFFWGGVGPDCWTTYWENPYSLILRFHFWYFDLLSYVLFIYLLKFSIFPCVLLTFAIRLFYMFIIVTLKTLGLVL